jgi:hypothetical protein
MDRVLWWSYDFGDGLEILKRGEVFWEERGDLGVGFWGGRI